MVHTDYGTCVQIMGGGGEYNVPDICLSGYWPLQQRHPPLNEVPTCLLTGKYGMLV